MTALFDPSGLSGVVQVAYVVDDVIEAAERWAKTMGAGPFFIGRNIPLSDCLYRGVEKPLDHTNACGQCGPVMLELVQQNNDGPSAFRDMYPPGKEGLHHMATFAADFDTELARYVDLGFEPANIATTTGGIRFAYIDTTAQLGHMMEFYQEGPEILGFYKMVADASKGWDGKNPIIER